MGYRIVQEDLERGGRIEYTRDLDTLERVEDVIEDSLDKLGVINSFEFSIEEDGKEFLVRQFELQGHDGVETSRLVVAATDETEHWAEAWLAS
jgi:hypothetical protein